ncbi:MAG TPA: hypothetical protein VF571_05050 [Pyrinomonadaceae bacterium]|jgi:hypothetical protein
MHGLKTFLDLLEWLAKYGFIDILFGIGIFEYFRRKFRRTIVEQINDVEIRRSFESESASYEIEIVNLSKEPLYVYQAYFTPFYLSDEGLLGYVYYYTKRDFPRLATEERSTLSGNYILTAINQNGDLLETPFLESKGALFYRVKIDNGKEHIINNRENLDELIEQRKCGTLNLKCVHGTKYNILRTRV